MTKQAHILHYIILVLGLSACLYGFVYFNPQTEKQILCALAGCIFYPLWGIIHGLIEERLNWHIAFEYITMSLFVFALLFISLMLK